MDICPIAKLFRKCGGDVVWVLWVCWLGFSLVGSILHLEDSPDSGTFKH